MNNLKRIRKNRILNQKDLANYLGVSITTYSRYERGEIRLTDDILIKLVHFYAISADFLLGITDIATVPVTRLRYY